MQQAAGHLQHRGAAAAAFVIVQAMSTCLPPEIWQHIMAQLPTDDRLRARPACKLLNQAALCSISEVDALIRDFPAACCLSDFLKSVGPEKILSVYLFKPDMDPDYYR